MTTDKHSESVFKGRAMTKGQIVGLAVKLFAIFLFVYSLQKLVNVLPWFSPDVTISWIAITYAVCYGLALVLICLVLWFFPLTVAKELIPFESGQPTTLSQDSILSIAFVILGLWVLSTAIPDMVYWSIVISQSREMGLSWQDAAADVKGNTYATILEIIIGLWLLLGAKGLKNILLAVRALGRKE